MQEPIPPSLPHADSRGTRSGASAARPVGPRLLACVLIWLVGAGSPSFAASALTVQSAILRTRVVVLDTVALKKALYVAFSLTLPNERRGRIDVRGRLTHDDALMAEASIALLEAPEHSGNLVFDVPYEIPDGAYTISVAAYDSQGNEVAAGSRTLNRANLRSDAADAREAPAVLRTEVRHVKQADNTRVAAADTSRGYVLFARSPLTYVFRESRPEPHEIIERLSAQAVRSADVVLNFSIHSVRSLDKMTIGVSALRNGTASLSKSHIQLACVESVADGVGMPPGNYRYLPTLIRPMDQAESSATDCSRVWITITVPQEAVPGKYSGTVTISTRNAPPTRLPIELSVSPVTLEDIPGVDYCMLMTYEFVELTMPWSTVEKAQIYRAATRVLRDYRRHGMTTLCLHSPFVLRTGADGLTILDDMFAALRAARDAGFSRPMVWYMGHLIQTSKPRHPGNIRNFDRSVHIPRLRSLVTSVSSFAKREGLPGVVVLPIDEPDDSFQDVGGTRGAVTPLLVETIRKAGAPSMITANRFATAGRPDYLAASQLRPEEVRAAHAAGAKYWRYENRVTTECDGPAYARYQYGYYVWKNGIDGMSSWTFQNTQNAGGIPGAANAGGLDVYLAYPAPSGPIATLKWEAIREGIDDRKLIHQLEKRMARMKSNGANTKRFDEFLAQLRHVDLEACCKSTSCPEEAVSSLDRQRKALIDMIVQADGELH